jgi:sugar lactone lactonase YvrE
VRKLFKAPLYGAVCLVVSFIAVPLLGVTAAHAAGPDPEGTIYVADAGVDVIDVFAPGTNGNVVPERTIEGADTGLSIPADVKVDANGDVYVSDFGSNSITEYAPGASGDATPICTISGSNTNLDENDDMSLEPDGTLVVGNNAANSVVVFAPGSCGNVTPEETIAGSNTGLNFPDGVGTDATGTIYADSSESDSIQIFPAGANGNVSPGSVISGSNTGLSLPDDIVVGFGGQLYVSNESASVEVFTPGSTGNATPSQNIAGSNTGLSDLLDDLAVDANGNMYVDDLGNDDVAEFASGANGNVSPIAVIGGSNTGFSEPEGTAVAGPPGNVSAKMTTQVAASSISLGQSTSDTATISGGTHSPTGSLVFKLFGPGDATCNNAPAFVSSSQTVSGDGAYPSPSFPPTSAGTYSWQALYSGDSNNSPITTACNDPNETVTVSSTCDDGPWPTQVTGVPTVNPGEPRGFYIGVNPANGEWVLQDTHNLTNPPHFITYSGTITTDGTFTNVMPISLQAHDVFTVSPDQHTLTFSFPDGGHVDALGFTPTCGSTLTFQGSIKGIQTPTTEIHLGVPASNPSTNPVTFTRTS